MLTDVFVPNKNHASHFREDEKCYFWFSECPAKNLGRQISPLNILGNHINYFGIDIDLILSKNVSKPFLKWNEVKRPRYYGCRN